MLRFSSLVAVSAVAVSTLFPVVSACFCAIGFQSGYTPAPDSSVQGGWTAAEATWKSPSPNFATYGGTATALTLQTNTAAAATAVNVKGLIWDTSSGNKQYNYFKVDTTAGFDQQTIGNSPTTGLQLPTPIYTTVSTDNGQVSGANAYSKSFYIAGNLTNCVIPAGSTSVQTSIEWAPYYVDPQINGWSFNVGDYTEDAYAYLYQPISVGSNTTATTGTQILVNKLSAFKSTITQDKQVYWTNQFTLIAGTNTLYLVIENKNIAPSNGENDGCPFIYKYNIYCSQTPSGTKGDPQFTGFLGQDYQIHGQSNTVYNILSTPTFQYNALFSFLDSGSCRVGTLCFAHPGNYFGAVGMMIYDAAKNATGSLLIEAGGVAEGMHVSFNSIDLTPSDHEFVFGDYTLSFPNQFEFVMESSEFNLKLENSDHFINQDVSISEGLMKSIAEHKQMKRVDAAQAEELESSLPHGLLGQTWQLKHHNNRWKFIEGHLWDYQMQDGILGKEFKYNRFQY